MRSVFILGFLLCGVYGISQINTIKILDRKTGGFIPFATVRIPHTNKAVIASENGTFTLDIEPGDTVLITSVGYQKKYELGKDLGGVIYMDSKNNVMQEVMVREKTFLQTIELGNGVDLLKQSNKRKFEDTKKADCINWGPGDVKEEFAEKIILPDTHFFYRVKKIYIPVRKWDCWGPLFLHIYTEDSLSEHPGEEIFSMPVEISNADVKRNTLVIDLSLKNIFIQDCSSFFISLGWLPEATKEKCVTTILMLKPGKGNTFARILKSHDYNWFPFEKLKQDDKIIQVLSAIYCVELDEMKYK